MNTKITPQEYECQKALGTLLQVRWIEYQKELHESAFSHRNGILLRARGHQLKQLGDRLMDICSQLENRSWDILDRVQDDMKGQRLSLQASQIDARGCLLIARGEKLLAEGDIIIFQAEIKVGNARQSFFDAVKEAYRNKPVYINWENGQITPSTNENS